MNFSSMGYFVTLAQERNFTRAAQRLHLTQQSLSSHIASMEKELGCQLFIRHVPLELTYAGEVFLRYATSFQREYDAMEREFCDIAQNQRGVLRVGITETRGWMVLPDAIARFQQAYPNIRIELTEASNDDLRQKLLEGDVDLAIANFPTSMQGVELRDFYREEVVLVMERSAFQAYFGERAGEVARRIEEGDYAVLADCPFVMGVADDVGGRIGREVMKRAGISQPTVKVLAGNMETLLALCLRGVGACFAPENLARASLSEEQMTRLRVFRLGEEARYQIRFGYVAKAYQWSLIEVFMDTAASTVRS